MENNGNHITNALINSYTKLYKNEVLNLYLLLNYQKGLVSYYQVIENLKKVNLYCETICRCANKLSKVQRLRTVHNNLITECKNYQIAYKEYKNNKNESFREVLQKDSSLGLLLSQIRDLSTAVKFVMDELENKNDLEK